MDFFYLNRFPHCRNFRNGLWNIDTLVVILEQFKIKVWKISKIFLLSKFTQKKHLVEETKCTNKKWIFLIIFQVFQIYFKITFNFCSMNFKIKSNNVMNYQRLFLSGIFLSLFMLSASAKTFIIGNDSTTVRTSDTDYADELEKIRMHMPI